MNYETFGILGINPNGDREQRTLCPECSAHRKKKNDKCLAVNLDEEIWFCHNCGWSGTLKSGKRFEPVEISKPFIEPPKNVLDFFTDRGISPEVVKRNKISIENVFMPQANEKKGCICFNYYIQDKLVNIKYRTKDKLFSQTKGGQKIFYKLNDVLNTDTVIITEGEIDALSFEQAGFKNAISVPDGAPNPNANSLTKKFEFIDNCSEYLQHVKKFYLAVDTDAPGLRLREELARRFGKDKCYIVTFPADCKDANEVLTKYGTKVLADCLNDENVELYPIEGVHYAKESWNELYDINENGFPDGATTGFEDFDQNIKFYPGQLTIWTGIPGHGKSNFTDNIMMRLAIHYDWKFGVFSPENGTPSIHIIRLIQILTGKPFGKNFANCASDAEIARAIDFIHNHFFFILPDDESYTLENILNCAKGLVFKHGIKGLIIDPWNTIEHQMERTENETIYTGKILNKLKYFSRHNGVHTNLVAHPRKMQKDREKGTYEIPTLYDISGSANWYNIADNGIVVYRDIQAEGTNKSTQTYVYVQKVKHKFIGKTGYSRFNFDIASQSYKQIPINSNPESSYIYEEPYLNNSREEEPF